MSPDVHRLSRKIAPVSRQVSARAGMRDGVTITRPCSNGGRLGQRIMPGLVLGDNTSRQDFNRVWARRRSDLRDTTKGAAVISASTSSIHPLDRHVVVGLPHSIQMLRFQFHAHVEQR